MRILLVKASNCRDVRLQKYIRSLKDSDNTLYFLGWERIPEDSEYSASLDGKDYVLKGFSSGATGIIFGTLIWLFRSFFWLLKSRNSFNIIYCADFEAAFPVWLASKFGNKTPYVYDVYDEFSLRYKMPRFVAGIFNFFERRIRHSAKLVIHVDEGRRSALDGNSAVCVIENSPIDYYGEEFVPPAFDMGKPEFAVTGYLTDRRGMYSILQFAKDNPSYHFFMAGRFKDKGIQAAFMAMPNVTVSDFIPQNKLFERIRSCNGIFSLYDPSVEINVKAASNKLYDAMMLGVPVITNEEINAGAFVKGKNLGVTVPYVYDKAIWDLKIEPLLTEASLRELGMNGRTLFESDYNFPKQVRSAFEI